MTKDEFKKAWHALDFTDSEWAEIENLHFTNGNYYPVVDGQPFIGSLWLAIAEDCSQKADAIDNGFYDMLDENGDPADDGCDTVAWAAQLREISDCIHRHFERCLR